jgi:hypothetical protein
MKNAIYEVIESLIVIIGAGPCGLAAAAELVCEGYVPLIITNRPLKRKEDFIREQYTTITPETHQILSHDKEKINDDEYKNILMDTDAKLHIWDNRQVTPIKAIEQALYLRMMKAYDKKPKVIDQAKILAIDKTQQIIFLKNLEENGTIRQIKVRYTELFLAEGGKREILKTYFLNNSESKMKLTPLKKGVATAYLWFCHFSIVLEQKQPLKKLTREPILSVEQTYHSIKDLPEFRKLGWDQPFPPFTFCLSNRSRTRVSVSGEAPYGIGRNPDKIKAWADLIISKQLGVETRDLAIIKTSNPYSIFSPPGILQKISPGHVKTRKGGYATGGETHIDSFYPAANGANMAIRSGWLYARCWKNGIFDRDRYLKEMQASVDSMETAIEKETQSMQTYMNSIRSSCSRL